jgi:hypothetical protein
MDSAMANAILEKKGERNTVDLQGNMRDALSMTTGESSVSFKESSNIATATIFLSKIENESVAYYPSTEEVIAFRGLPKPSIGVRSSARLGSQPNADMPQLEKAMKNVQSRDESFSTGQSSTPMFSIVNIPDSEIVKRVDGLGISLGNSVREVHKSIKGIKMVEEESYFDDFEKERD